MGEVGWISEPAALDLADRPLGSTLCLGPRPGPDPDTPGYGERTPQAFLAQLSADYLLDVHFHPVDQFQWFVRGGGRFGSHDVRLGTVHYADRYTPYGPLRASEAGVSFYTMRGVSDTGAHYMPGSRERLQVALRSGEIEASGRRNEAWDLLAVEPEPGEWHDVRADPDGLRVAVALLAIHAALPATKVAGSGAYLAIVDGTVCYDRTPLAACGFTWLDAGSAMPDVTAALAHTRVGLFQLPD